MAELMGKVAVLVTDGFEQVELTRPMQALRDAGADARIVSPREGKVKGWAKTDWGDEFDVDIRLGDARAGDYDALLLPGGVMNPDKLRKDRQAVAFVREFFDAGKPVAAICHGPWLLIDAGVAEGRRVTSYDSIRRDLENAGAVWVDEEVVVDSGLVTSRNPDDIPAFNRKMIEGSARVCTRGSGGRSRSCVSCARPPCCAHGAPCRAPPPAAREIESCNQPAHFAVPPRSRSACRPRCSPRRLICPRRITRRSRSG